MLEYAKILAFGYTKPAADTYELEPLSEVLASQIAAVLCPKAVRYHLDYNHGRLVSKCKLFTTETVGLVKAADVVGDKRTIAELLPWFASIGGEDEFRRMCILDAVILNTEPAPWEFRRECMEFGPESFGHGAGVRQ